MKEKKRYLFVEGNSLKKNIPAAIYEFIGTLGMSKAGLKFIELERDHAIICVNRDSLEHVRASLCVYRDKIFVKKVSGTLKGLKG